MAYVIGPNGVKTYVPDNVARSLVGNGKRGYQYAPALPAPSADPAPETPAPKTPRKRASRRTTKPSSDS